MSMRGLGTPLGALPSQDTLLGAFPRGTIGVLRVVPYVGRRAMGAECSVNHASNPNVLIVCVTHTHTHTQHHRQ